MKLWIRAKNNEKLVLNQLVQNDKPITVENLTIVLMDLCDKFDMPTPVVTQNNVDNLAEFNYTRFKQRDFLEKISFDYLEISNIPK